MTSDQGPVPAPPVTAWADGEAYERYVGRWSRLVAPAFLDWLAPAPAAAWLDVGCGTGALTDAILRRASPASIVGIDDSAGFVAHALDRTRDDRATFVVGDAQALPVDDAAFDVAVAGLLLNHLPEPDRALGEMARAVRPGGTVAAYVWDYAGEMQLMRQFWDASADLDPAAAELHQGRRYAWCKPGPLEAMFTRAALEGVEVQAIDVATTFRDFDDYWLPFLGGTGPAPSYAMSLSEERRAALREQLRATLPTADDGSIHLIARAWAIRGRRPPRV